MSWAWTSLPTTGINATNNQSEIVTSITEDYMYGMGSSTTALTAAGADPTILIVGASTWGNTLSWGLLSWQPWINVITTDGATATSTNASTAYITLTEGTSSANYASNGKITTTGTSNA